MTTLYFNQVVKAVKQLTRVGIQLDLKEHTYMALYFFKSSGEFNAAVREWDAKPTINKTWANIKTFMSTEYAKENKKSKFTAKQFKVNALEEQVEAREELITHLAEAHIHQMETLVKSTTEAMKEMLALVKGNNSQAKATN